MGLHSPPDLHIEIKKNQKFSRLRGGGILRRKTKAQPQLKNGESNAENKGIAKIIRFTKTTQFVYEKKKSKNFACPI